MVPQMRSRGIDYVGLALIATGLGCMQVMTDRGEDDDWFGSNFIRRMRSWPSSAYVGRLAGC